MIADKKKVGIFLKKLDRLCKFYGVNIRGHVAFFDEEWGDWLELVCNGERSVVKYVGPDEMVEVFDPEEKLEEIHRDLLVLQSEVLDLTKQQLLTQRKRNAKKRNAK